MIWSETEPTKTELASTIPTLIQNMKTAIRERFEVNNGTIKEHGASDSADSGKHPMSKVAFCKVVDDWTNRPTTNLVEGSLIYVKAPSDRQGLYRITSDNNYRRISPLSHTKGTQEHPKLANMHLDSDGNPIDNHNQYALKDEDVTMESDITVDELIIDNIPEEIDAPIDVTHESQKFHPAHGDSSIDATLLQSLDCDLNTDFNIQRKEGTDEVTFPEGSTLFMPWTKAPDNTPRAIVILNDRIKIMDKDMTSFLTDGVTIHIWYIPPEGETW